MVFPWWCWYTILSTWHIKGVIRSPDMIVRCALNCCCFRLCWYWVATWASSTGSPFFLPFSALMMCLSSVCSPQGLCRQSRSCNKEIAGEKYTLLVSSVWSSILYCNVCEEVQDNYNDWIRDNENVDWTLLPSPWRNNKNVFVGLPLQFTVITKMCLWVD